MSESCGVMLPRGAQPGSRPQARCERPAIIRVEYGCVHEHMGNIDACDRHAEKVLAKVTWCSGCWNGPDPHRCLLLGQVVAS